MVSVCSSSLWFLQNDWTEVEQLVPSCLVLLGIHDLSKLDWPAYGMRDISLVDGGCESSLFFFGFFLFLVDGGSFVSPFWF